MRRMLVLVLCLVIVGVSGNSTTVAPAPEKVNNVDKIKIQFYYESLCPASVYRYENDLLPAVKKFHQYLDVKTYPYGNAAVNINHTTVTVNCQHGKDECYGNELHACAIDVLGNFTDYVPFNSCLMWDQGPYGSTDAVADTCGEKLQIDSKPIKDCAKELRGFQLLLNHAVENEKAKPYRGVPHVLVNGQKVPSILTTVCGILENPSPYCDDL